MVLPADQEPRASSAAPTDALLGSDQGLPGWSPLHLYVSSSEDCSAAGLSLQDSSPPPDSARAAEAASASPPHIAGGDARAKSVGAETPTGDGSTPDNASQWGSGEEVDACPAPPVRGPLTSHAIEGASEVAASEWHASVCKSDGKEAGKGCTAAVPRGSPRSAEIKGGSGSRARGLWRILVSIPLLPVMCLSTLLCCVAASQLLRHRHKRLGCMAMASNAGCAGGQEGGGSLGSVEPALPSSVGEGLEAGSTLAVLDWRAGAAELSGGAEVLGEGRAAGAQA